MLEPKSLGQSKDCVERNWGWTGYKLATKGTKG